MYERRFEALPRQADIVKIYYHGTPKIDSGESILINGIKPPDLQNRKKQMTTPVEGKVYLTPHIDYAIIYCIGANMAGHSLPEKWINENPFGYLFIIDCTKTKTFPEHAVFVKSNKQFLPWVFMNWNALVTNLHETPAPINNETPEPKPHFVTTSSI